MKDEDPRKAPGADTQGTGGAGASPGQRRKDEKDTRALRDGKVYSGTSRDGLHREEDGHRNDR